MTTLRIHEIFHSIQGESTRIGEPTVFVRLTGCPLRCGYCDTEYAFHGGSDMSLEDILNQVAAYEARYVCVTGGEPLAQKTCHALLTALCDQGYLVSLETSGAMNIAEVDARVKIIMDIKTPGSGEVNKNLWTNLDHLKSNDEVKWVLCGEDDYAWAKTMLDVQPFPEEIQHLFSPSFHDLPPATLASWVLADKLNVRMQVQLHKILWGEKKGV